jgi:hypothetical protein
VPASTGKSFGMRPETARHNGTADDRIMTR